MKWKKWEEPIERPMKSNYMERAESAARLLDNSVEERRSYSERVVEKA